MSSKALLLGLASLLLSSVSCCCSTGWTDRPETPAASDEPEIERVGRAYVVEHQDELFGGSADGGGRGGECSSAASLATELTLAVLSRGHSGSGPTATATFDLAACARQVLVYVVSRAGILVAVGASLRLPGSELSLRFIGEEPRGYRPTHTTGTDSHHRTGELF